MTKLNCKIGLLLFLASASGYSFAGNVSLPQTELRAVKQQSITIKGTVKDKENGILPGVSVTLKGTTKIAVTDIQGKYTIQVPDENSVLLFSYVGFVPLEETVRKKTEINVVLLSDQKSLGEVAVIGYGAP